MLLFKKKAFITDWWIAEKGDKLKFVDITNERNITSNCIVQGRTHALLQEHMPSIHSVVKVTKKGIYTSSGRFYSFKTAHPLFLIFLSEIHTPNDALIASKWECVDPDNSVYLADIENASGQIKKDIVFDFEQVMDDEIFFVGTSDMLDDVVILNPFDMREFSEEQVMKEWYPSEVYDSAIKFGHTKKIFIKKLNKILKKQNRKDMDS